MKLITEEITEGTKVDRSPSLMRVLELYLENRVTMDEEERAFIIAVLKYLIPAESLRKASLPIEKDWFEKAKGKFARRNKKR